MIDPVRDWNLLNEAQAIIPKLSEAQQRVMAADLSKLAPAVAGHIFPGNIATARKLEALGLIRGSRDFGWLPTDLGAKVRDVLRGRQS